MSPDEIQFILVLYLIYLSDCLALPRSSGHLLYQRIRGTAWKLKSTFKAVVLADRFWLLRPVLIPMGSSYTLTAPRCAMGRHGVCSRSPLSRLASNSKLDTVRFTRYEQLASLEVKEGALHINGTAWCQGPAAELADLARTLREVASAPDREATLRRQMRDAFIKGSSAPEQLSLLKKQTFWLNLLSSCYAVWLLIFTPVLLFHSFVEGLIWVLPGPLLFLHVGCGILFVRTHRRLFPEAVYARWEAFCKMMICPPMMLRACDACENLVRLEGAPAAIMFACCEESVWRPEIRRLWRSLIPARYADIPPEAAEAMADYASLYREELRVFLEERNILPASLEVDSACIPVGQSCCPCCEALYKDTVSDCPDCNHVALLKPTR